MQNEDVSHDPPHGHVDSWGTTELLSLCDAGLLFKCTSVISHFDVIKPFHLFCLGNEGMITWSLAWCRHRNVPKTGVCILPVCDWTFSITFILSLFESIRNLKTYGVCLLLGEGGFYKNSSWVNHRKLCMNIGNYNGCVPWHGLTAFLTSAATGMGKGRTMRPGGRRRLEMHI